MITVARWSVVLARCLDHAGENQREEAVVGSVEAPPDVNAAAGTQNDAPGVARKPCVRGGRSSDAGGALGAAEAADVKREAVRVDEMVAMGAAALDGLRPARDHFAAGRAPKRRLAGAAVVDALEEISAEFVESFQ